jgi:vacuolar-type H+-ATPase catalytic subunit A/Vma1
MVALAFALGTFVRGQGLPAPQGRSGRTDKIQRELQRQVEMQLIEQALMEGNSRHVKRYQPQVLDQIREDFLQIQIIDREVIRGRALADQFDLHLVAKSAGEIRKRSSRLKENLALLRSEAPPADRSRAAVEATREGLRTSLAELSDLIEEFVSNPMFEQSKVVDARLSSKARRDIEAIIELSRQVKRSSEKLQSSKTVNP